jgi:hypothetical protein
VEPGCLPHRQHWFTTRPHLHTVLFKGRLSPFNKSSLSKPSTPAPSTPALNKLVLNFDLAYSYRDDRHLSNQPAEIAFSMAEQSINIPQVLVFAVVAFLVYRWYSSKPSANGTRPVASRSVRINPAQIDTIAQMFPQLSRRDIAWDLQRNGGNAAATTERVLSGRSLDSVCCFGFYLR